jgi:hypothetical protein
MRTLQPPPWAWSEGPRVLVEHPDFDRGLECACALRDAGYAVAVCPGPHEADGSELGCPLVEGDECALVRGADVVVSALRSAAEEANEVLDALRLRGGTAVVAVDRSDTPERCVAVVRDALRRRSGPPSCVAIARVALQKSSTS